MKSPFLYLSAAVLLSACTDNAKDLTSVSQGMTKSQVVQAIGEPSRKNNLELAELWTYKDYNKTLIFRSDTVYDIITASTINTDSIENSFKDVAEDIKQGVKKIGRELDTVGEKLEDGLDRDTINNR